MSRRARSPTRKGEQRALPAPAVAVVDDDEVQEREAREASRRYDRSLRDAEEMFAEDTSNDWRDRLDYSEVASAREQTSFNGNGRDILILAAIVPSCGMWEAPQIAFKRVVFGPPGSIEAGCIMLDILADRMNGTPDRRLSIKHPTPGPRASEDEAMAAIAANMDANVRELLGPAAAAALPEDSAVRRTLWDTVKFVGNACHGQRYRSAAVRLSDRSRQSRSAARKAVRR